jgi:hypothetical protein
MNDDFLTRFRKPPRPEFAAALYRRISQPMNTKNAHLRSRLLTASVLAMLLAIVLLFTNPRLQALAQEILRFFTPAQSNKFALPTHDTVPEITATPTFAAPVLAGCEDVSALLTYRCVVGGAEVALGFDVRELPSDPEGFTFIGASANPTQSLIRLTYTRDGGELTITQIHGASASSVWESTWDAVPTDSVEKVQINGFAGEYVRGMFVVKSQTGTEAVWEPDAAIQRLRWREGDMLFEIQMGGLPGDDEAIGKNWLITLAESLR